MKARITCMRSPLYSYENFTKFEVNTRVPISLFYTYGMEALQNY